jgi:hypothetical protein
VIAHRGCSKIPLQRLQIVDRFLLTSATMPRLDQAVRPQ